ncbi:Sulfotransferase family protein [Geodermatophilus telluris]|uniref:Sulfotransferase family protein n=1 Tax=Geodermatophilus telluris TaxID=1190417 RepID=A0A1G6L5M5_9ACTN|nr:sulfotransferase [Geodermatophilus telluris]SDC38487.1 Sulfotransferase family protein [Geodermatophilus telluris]
MSRTKVLSIVGPGRSGTTILAGALGEADGVVDVGELRWLWRRGLLEQRSCGCGLPPDQCPVWSAVLVKAGGGAPQSVTAIAAAQDALAPRRRRLRVIRTAATGRTGWAALDEVRGITARLIPAIAEVTGARVLVDSSKRAQDAAVMAGLDQVDHYVLHIVRDPGAVAFSWQRRNKTVPIPGAGRTMATRRLVPSMARWTENCLSAEALRRFVPPDRWLFLRYEDFAAAPEATVGRVLTFLHEDAAPPFIDDRTVVLGVHHTVEGNPNRFRVGPVRISLDDEWRRRMPRRRQLVVRALAWPFLLYYRYPLLTGAARTGGA